MLNFPFSRPRPEVIGGPGWFGGLPVAAEPKPDATRRDVLAAVGPVAVALATVHTAHAGASDAEWLRISDQVHAMAPENGRRVVQVARGLDPFAWAGTSLARNHRNDPANFPQLHFQGERGEWLVTPRGAVRACDPARTLQFREDRLNQA
jgi:hypothetical protein